MRLARVNDTSVRYRFFVAKRDATFCFRRSFVQFPSTWKYVALHFSREAQKRKFFEFSPFSAALPDASCRTPGKTKPIEPDTDPLLPDQAQQFLGLKFTCLLTNHLQSRLHTLQAIQHRQRLQSSTKKKLYDPSYWSNVLLVHVQVACATCARTATTCDLWDSRLSDDLKTTKVIELTIERRH
jgi:hypothetical protein